MFIHPWNSLIVCLPSKGYIVCVLDVTYDRQLRRTRRCHIAVEVDPHVERGLRYVVSVRDNGVSAVQPGHLSLLSQWLIVAVHTETTASTMLLESVKSNDLLRRITCRIVGIHILVGP